MSIIDTSVKKPVTMLMALMAIYITAFVSLSKLSVDFFPNIEMSTLMIRTTYDGAGPEEVEKTVTRLVENAVSAVNNIDKVTSTSSEGSSIVEVQFKYGTDLDAATADVREKLDRIGNSLPDGADKPTVFKFSSSSMPVMGLGVAGSDDMFYLYDLAENKIAKRLEQVDGVANVSVMGGMDRQVHVNVSKNRLQAYGLSFATIQSALAVENQNIAGGYTYEGSYKYTIRTVGEFQSLDDIRNVIVAMKSGVPVRLRDVAEVEYSYDENSSIIRINGKPGIRLMITKESGKNTVAVANGVHKAIKELEEELPAQIVISPIFDSSDNIKNSIRGVVDAVWQGSLITILVLLIYLWDIRYIMIIGISIPTSIVSTFILMYAFNVTLNIISLAGLSLGVGMMVDASIVVLDNINYHRKQGMGRYSASIMGTKQVVLAISASTLTTIAVFLPIVFVQGFTAQIFRDLALTVSISLITSLIAAMTVIPMLTSQIRSTHKWSWLVKMETRFEKEHAKIDEFYSKVLLWTMKRKKLVVFGSMGAVILLIAVMFPLIGKEFFPNTDEGRFSVGVTLPVGTRVEYTDSIVKDMESKIVSICGSDLKTMETSVRGGGWFGGSSDNQANIRVSLVSSDKRSRSLAKIMEDIRKMAEGYPAQINVRSEGMGRMMMGNTTDLSIEVQGDNLETDGKLADQLVALMKTVPGVRDAQLNSDDPSPEIEIRINRDMATRAGLTTSAVANAIETGFGGTTATVMRESDGNERDVVVQLVRADRITVDDLNSLSLQSSSGSLVPLTAVAKITKTTGPTTVDREDSTRYVSVVADVFGRKTSDVVRDIQKAVAENLYIPASCTIVYGGSYKDMQESFGQIVMMLVLAIVLVYAIMASQFESLVAPFVIMFAVPFGVAGAMIALKLTGLSLSIVSGAGIVVLVGIVINNGIVLLDYFNQLLHERMPVEQAAVKSGVRRLRPVAMTTWTTVVGLIPMALGLGEGGELYMPLAVSILGGLIVSFLFTLVIVPTAYAGIRNRFPIKFRDDDADYRHQIEISADKL